LDGPWGLDYSKSQTTISSFVIDNIPSANITDDQYAIKKHIVTGDIWHLNVKHSGINV
jgi:hypothetical protein